MSRDYPSHHIVNELQGPREMKQTLYSEHIQARTGGGIHGYPSLETPIHPVGNLQALVGNLSDILMKEEEGQIN
jgi:hypothetical protein